VAANVLLRHGVAYSPQIKTVNSKAELGDVEGIKSIKIADASIDKSPHLIGHSIKGSLGRDLASDSRSGYRPLGSDGDVSLKEIWRAVGWVIKNLIWVARRADFVGEESIVAGVDIFWSSAPFAVRSDYNHRNSKRRGVSGIFDYWSNIPILNAVESNGRLLLQFADVDEGALSCLIRCQSIFECVVGFFEGRPLEVSNVNQPAGCQDKKSCAYAQNARPAGDENIAARSLGWILFVFGGAAAFGGIWILYFGLMGRDHWWGISIALFLICGGLWMSTAGMNRIIGVDFTTLSIVSPLTHSACLNRGAENVRIPPMVVAELKFRDVQRHIFGADLVERTHDTALENRPEAFNRIGVDRADDVALRGMHHGLPVVFGQIVVNLIFIGREKADIGGNHFANEMFGGIFGDAAQCAGDHVALAADSADDWRFTGTCAARFAVMLLVPMPVCVFAANPRFVNFDNAAQLHFRFNECGADFMAHGMCGPVRAEAHHALDLQGANPLLAGQHQMSDAEPLAERLVRVLKDGPGDVGEAVAFFGAGIALPLEGHRADRENFDVAATRAGNAVRPAPRDQIDAAGIFIGKGRFKLSDCHLMNWLRSAGHLASPISGNEYGI
jgi:hypothetical protein